MLAYQYGAGLCELLTPTNGALMAILSASRVRFSDWLRFTWPLYLALIGLGLAAVLLGVAIRPALKPIGLEHARFCDPSNFPTGRADRRRDRGRSRLPLPQTQDGPPVGG